MKAEDKDPRYHLNAAEDREWNRVRHEPPTRDDWAYLQELITTYKRRRIANSNHARPTLPTVPPNREIREGDRHERRTDTDTDR